MEKVKILVIRTEEEWKRIRKNLYQYFLNKRKEIVKKELSNIGYDLSYILKLKKKLEEKSKKFENGYGNFIEVLNNKLFIKFYTLHKQYYDQSHDEIFVIQDRELEEYYTRFLSKIKKINMPQRLIVLDFLHDNFIVYLGNKSEYFEENTLFVSKNKNIYSSIIEEIIASDKTIGIVSKFEIGPYFPGEIPFPWNGSWKHGKIARKFLEYFDLLELFGKNIRVIENNLEKNKITEYFLPREKFIMLAEEAGMKKITEKYKKYLELAEIVKKEIIQT